MAVTLARKTDERVELKLVSVPLAASTAVIKGSMIGLNAAGNCVPVTEATGLKCVGICEESVDNSAGSAGDLRAVIRYGTFKMSNATSTDAITRADIGQAAYGVDNETVSDVATGRSIVGAIVDVDSQDSGIWVRMWPDSVACLTDLDT